MIDRPLLGRTAPLSNLSQQLCDMLIPSGEPGDVFPYLPQSNPYLERSAEGAQSGARSGRCHAPPKPAPGKGPRSGPESLPVAGGAPLRRRAVIMPRHVYRGAVIHCFFIPQAVIFKRLFSKTHLSQEVNLSSLVPFPYGGSQTKPAAQRLYLLPDCF